MHFGVVLHLKDWEVVSGHWHCVGGGKASRKFDRK